MTGLTRELADSVGDTFNANNIGAVMKHFRPRNHFAAAQRARG